MGDVYSRNAKAAGVSTKGKKYMSSLARFPGDPEAWVSGKGDAERILDERGWGSEGLINRPVRNEAPPKEHVPVASEVLQEAVIDRMQDVVDAGGRPSEVNVHDVAQEEFEKRKGPWVKDSYSEAMLGE